MWQCRSLSETDMTEHNLVYVQASRSTLTGFKTRLRNQTRSWNRP
jgi:hypothetical protein